MANRHRHSCIVLGLLLAVQLGACNSPPLAQDAPQARAAPDKSSEAPEKVTEPVVAQSDVKKQEKPEAPVAVARTEPTPPAAPPRKLATPLPVTSLIGLDREEARKLVGLPDNTSDDPPSVTWEYRHDQCVLKLHFYLEVTKKVYRILNTKFEIQDGSQLSEQGCLDVIRSAT